jgi:uncharacterized damage-inducible protein DinB
MTSQELLQSQLDDARFQLEKAFEGLSATAWTTPVAPHAMSPLDMAIHLADCYVAARKSVSGENHEWGAYTMEGTSQDQVLATMFNERVAAIEAVLAAGEENFGIASGYIVLHDTYHVGQLVLGRLGEADWNAYSIYP